MKTPVKYQGWFKQQAGLIRKLKIETEALRVEHKAVLQDIEAGKDYAHDLENALQVLDAEFNRRRKELAKRFATYDVNFKNEVLLDPTLLE